MRQLDLSKSARAALVAKKCEELWNLEQKYDGLTETKMLWEKKVQARKDAAKEQHDALSNRLCACATRTCVCRFGRVRAHPPLTPLLRAAWQGTSGRSHAG